MSSTYDILYDTFTGTATASLTGNAPNTVQSGSVLWTDLGGTYSHFVYASGGGIVAPSLTGGFCGAIYDPGSSIASDQVLSVVFKSSTLVPQHQIQLHKIVDGEDDEIELTVNYESQLIAIQAYTGGVLGLNASVGVTLAANTSYRLVATVAGTTLTVTLNGSPVGTSYTVPATAGRAILLGTTT
jgi:hypothetical protein